MKIEADEMTLIIKELIKTERNNTAQEIGVEMKSEPKMMSRFNKMITKKNQAQDKKKIKSKFSNKC